MKQTINSLLSSIYLHNWKVLEKALLVVVLLDLALGGNGYLVQLGGIRLRVLLYAFCLAWAILRLTRIQPVRVDVGLLWISVSFAAVTAIGAAYGYLAGHRLEAIAAELKPLAYFPMLFFFLVAIRTRKDATLAAGILVACGMLLAVLYLLLLLVAMSGVVSHSSIRHVLRLSDEFIFRRDIQYGPFVGFLYKGDLYICVACLFLLFDPFRRSKILAIVALIAIAMTLTRGLCIATVVCMIAGVVLGQKWNQTPMFLAQTALLFTVLFFAQQAEMDPPSISSPSVAARHDSAANTAGEPAAPQGDPGPVQPADECLQDSACGKMRTLVDTLKRSGDSMRLDDLKFIFERMDFSTATIGHGLGAPIRDRERIEMTYFEVFYKQGLLGLSVWFALFAYTFYLYLKVPGATKQFGLAFFLASLFVFVETATNTFLTGSIGMAVVFIATGSLRVLATEKIRPMQLEDWYGRWSMRWLRA